MARNYFLILGFIFFAGCQPEKRKVKIWQVPGVNEYAIINTKGNSVLPSGYVTPAGETIRIDRAPYGLSISPDGKKILVLHHNGTVTISEAFNVSPTVRIPSFDKKIAAVMEGASFLVAAFSADSKLAYLSGGDLGKIMVLDVTSYKKVGEINLNGAFEGVDYQESFTSDLTIQQSIGHQK
jgi:WD40 repeat protein